MKRLILILCMLFITIPVITHAAGGKAVPSAVEQSFDSVISGIVIQFGPGVTFTENITWEHVKGDWQGSGYIYTSDGHIIQIPTSGFTNKGVFEWLNYIVQS